MWLDMPEKSILFKVRSPLSGEYLPVPNVDQAQMREVDRIAVEDFGLGILQMMENAGRNLAAVALQSLGADRSGRVIVAAGSGGNGGGGMCAARHLHNRGVPVSVLLTRPPEELGGAAAVQCRILQQAGVPVRRADQRPETLQGAVLILDALIGYSLRGAPSGISRALIEQVNASGCPAIALDLPSGLDASSGVTPGVCIRAEQTVTLALPKPGLTNPVAGALILADIGIPPSVYQQLGVDAGNFWGREWRLPLRRIAED